MNCKVNQKSMEPVLFDGQYVLAMKIKEYKKLEKTEIKKKGEMGEWLKPQVC